MTRINIPMTDHERAALTAAVNAHEHAINASLAEQGCRFRLKHVALPDMCVLPVLTAGDLPA
jgi:hypothetical protein